LSDWKTKDERQTRSERFSDIMQSDLSAFRKEVAGAFTAERGRVFVLGDILLALLMKPLGRTLLAIASLFFLWLLL
jgi:hypothetical protein